jgi:hypothetical protein
MTPSARLDEARGPWRVRGVSVQGYRHLAQGVECQDAYRHSYEPSTGAYTLAVADGAGSRARAAEGATLAVGLAVEVLGTQLAAQGPPQSADRWRAWLSDGYQAIVRSFREATTRLASDPGEFATTLTAVVLTPPWVGMLRLGDGFVVGRAEDNPGEESLHLLSVAAPAGEYVNETVFLTSARALQDVDISCVYDDALTAVLVATDGLAPASIRHNGGRQVPNLTFIAPVLSSLAAPRSDPTEVARLLLDSRISELGGDDKTLVAAVKA